MKKLLTLITLVIATTGATFAQSVAGGSCSELILSEYVEGWGNNKAVEIYNPTPNSIDLSFYQVARYSNGSTSPSPVWLSGTIQPYDVFVVVLDKRDPNGTGLEEPIDAELEAVADLFVNPVFNLPTSALYFNGNDAVALLNNSGTVIDILGRIGEDPGVAWSDQNGTWWTANHTLVRKANIEVGDFNGFDAFMPELEWDSLPVNTFSGLGTHQSTCYTGPCNTPSNVSFSGLNTDYEISESPSVLTGTPSGGTFHGPGVSGNQFDPSSAGLGQHSIVYTYTNGNGCTGAFALCTTVDFNVGIGGTEIESTEGLDVYPNPSTGRFTLSLEDVTGVVRYSVYDAQGKEIAFDAFVANGITQETIDLTDFAEGVYTLQLSTTKGSFTDKLVKD